MEERFALVSSSDLAVALWCGRHGGLLKLRAGACYRLDYIEVNPALQRTQLGAFVFALVCKRALEMQADGLVLGSFPDPSVQDFYGRLGGVAGGLPDWTAEKGLTKFLFSKPVLQNLEELADAYVVDENGN
jgi:hypothetical protein